MGAPQVYLPPGSTYLLEIGSTERWWSKIYKGYAQVVALKYFRDFIE